MIAHDSRPPDHPRQGLSTLVRAQLARALQAEWGAPAGSRDQLEAAVAAAAEEAMHQGLLPEDLIIDLKDLERTVLRVELADGDQRRFHDWLVAVCLKAYYRA